MNPATPIAAPAPPRSFARWGVVVACVMGPILLSISAYGLWRWFNLPVFKMPDRGDIFYIICLVILPLLLFLFLSVTATQRFEHTRLSSGYQTRLDQVQKRLHHQEDLLQLIMNCHPESVTIFDRSNRYWFVNRFAAEALGSSAKDIIGKPPARVLGADKARRLEARLTEVQNSRRAIEAMEQVTDAKGRVRFIQIHYEAIEPSSGFPGGVMVREEDLTNLIVERERRETMLRQVIGTLVAVVDRRDPYAAGHSARVGQLARAIAEEMVLDEKLIETAEIAGSLMNFGKVLVPREILTKTSPLAPEELQRIRDSILTSADILSIIDFSGPVVATLRQVLERFDGEGVPHGLKGDAISIAARIVTVANAYVALVSPRAHRPSLALKEALEHMMRDADKAFDRRVLVALSNYLENRPTKLDWLTQTKQA
jgi:PAS domain S-box-containing protein